MNDNIVFFKTKSRLMLQLGEQLIKNESIAILELIKNSYDAGASEVNVTMNNLKSSNGKIVIEDNGTGMTLDVVKNVWMQIGTDYKGTVIKECKDLEVYKRKIQIILSENNTNDKKIQQVEEVLAKSEYWINKFKETLNIDLLIKEIDFERIKMKRMPLGEKGIGRFGAHKLGKKIKLNTKSLYEKEIQIQIDWNIFEQCEYLDDVSVNVNEVDEGFFKKGSTGTRIEITDLKTDWTKGKLREIYRSINSLNSPFESIDSFNVKLKTNYKEWLEGMMDYNHIKDYALYKAQILISQDRINSYHYEFLPWENMDKIEKRINDRNDIKMVINNGSKKQELIDLSKYMIGEVKVDLLMFDLDSNILSTIDDRKGLKDYLKQNGGIYVYRDGMRIYDYGEPGNDWLNLESKRINDPSATISSNIVIGAISINRNESYDLIEKANREGFVENDAYDEFKKAIIFAIEKAQTDRKIDKDKIRKTNNSSKKKEPVLYEILNLRKKIDKKISDESLKNEINKCLDNIEKDYLYINQVYVKSSTSGLTLTMIIHEIEKIIKELEAAVLTEDSSLHIKSLIMNLSKITSSFADIMKNRSKKQVEIKELVNCAIDNVAFRLNAHNIQVINICDNYTEKNSLKCVNNLLIGTIMNLIDNAIWWLDYAEIVDKKIFFALTDNLMDNCLSLIIADNGKGFTLPTDEIIKPFISDRPGGMGLGLHLAKEVLSYNKGNISFPDYHEVRLPKEFENGAIIALNFDKENLL